MVGRAERAGTTPTRRPGCRRCARPSSPAATPRPTPSRRRCRGRTTSPTSRSATCSSTSTSPGAVEGYRRELDLDRAVATTTFRAGGALHTREAFASFPDQVDRPPRRRGPPRAGVLHGAARRAGCGTRPRPRARTAIALRGRAPSHVDPSYLGDTKDAGPLRRGAGRRGHALHRDRAGGRARRDRRARRPRAGSRCAGRTRPSCFVSAGDELQRLRQVARRARAGTPTRPRDGRSPRPPRSRSPALRDAHVADHARLFGRVRLDLGAPAADRPTDERLRAYRHGEDPALVALVFQYGRYLLVASSRPGTQPANLQGIWNEDVRPPWSANWTMNINSEMNYWPAEVTNLSECHEPMLRMIAELARERPRDRARQLRRAGLGRPPQRRPLAADGPRRQLGPGRPEVGQLADGRRLALDGPVGALRVHARRRVAARLRLAAPAGRGRVRARLARPGREGRPRHRAVLLARERRSARPTARRPRSRRPTTSDVALLRELFANAIEASTILGVDAALRREMEGALARLPPYRVGGARPAPGVERGLRGARAAPPAHVAPHRPAPRPQHHARGDARARRGGAPLARAARRRQHRLVDGLEGEPVGPPRRRGPRAPPDRLPAPARRHDEHRLLRRAAASTPTSSTPTRRSRSTATSA